MVLAHGDAPLRQACCAAPRPRRYYAACTGPSRELHRAEGALGPFLALFRAERPRLASCCSHVLPPAGLVQRPELVPALFQLR